MSEAISIHAVSVTQNTSHFAELMLRTLFATNDLSGFDFKATILDNNSAGPEHESLKVYTASQHIEVTSTGYGHYVAAEQHGAALTDFVRDHNDYSHYLFLDADMWFIEPNTIATMLDELLTAPDDTFGIQARIFGYYAGFVYEGRDGIPGTNAFDHIPTWPIEFEGRTYKNVYAPRLTPVCSLIANTPLFRKVARAVGLGQAISFRVGKVTYYDTFGLMTQVMATHLQQFIVSSKMVNHFTQTTYLDAQRGDRDRDCSRMLDQYRH